MIYIEPKSTDIAFHLAAEEYAAKNFTQEQSVFMFWRTEKCCIIGRYQIAAAEIDLQAAHSLGIGICRRSSGGGAMFSDPENIMYTLVSPFNRSSDDPRKIEREKFAEPMARALIKMGVPAVVEGRNDITAEGRKFSGLAQYAVKNKLCSHGSLLYNSDLDMLARLLNPDPEKIISKAVSSVKSRVVNISKYFNPKISTDDFLARLKFNLFEETETETETKTENYEFTEHDIKQINIIRSEKYANPDWTTGASPKFSFHSAKRFPAGKIEIFLDVERGIIKSCKIFGDFLGIYPVESLEEKFINQPHEFGILSDILAGIDLRFYMGNIKPEELIECLF